MIVALCKILIDHMVIRNAHYMQIIIMESRRSTHVQFTVHSSSKINDIMPSRKVSNRVQRKMIKKIRTIKTRVELRAVAANETV